MDKNNFNNQIYLKGKGIKYAVLVDNKNNLKVIPYNFDYLTFLFGGVMYLFRKEILKGIALLFVQALSIYLLNVPIGIILSFIITFIVAIFSGKAYTNKFIKEGALPFDEYEENGYSHEYDENIVLSRSDEKKGTRMSQDYKYSIKKQNTVFYCVGILVLVCITLLTGFKMKVNSNNSEHKVIATKSSEDLANENSEDLNDEDKRSEIPNEFIILLTDDKNIDSFALINFDKDKHKMNGKYYNGQVLIRQGDTSIPLNEIFKDKGIIPDEVFKKYFGIDKKIHQIKVDVKKAEEIMPELKDSKIEDKYKGILINTTKLDDEKYEKIVRDASILNKVDDKVEENYLNYDIALKYKDIIEDSKETIDIKKGNYYEIALNSIVSNKAIKALGDNVKENVLYYFDYSDLDYNSLVKKLKAKDKELKEAKAQEETNNSIANNNIANNTTQSSNNNYNVNTNYNKTSNNSGYNNYKSTRPQVSGSNNSIGSTGNGGSVSNGGNVSNGSSSSNGSSKNIGSSGGGTVEESNAGSNGSNTESNPDSGSGGNNQNQENEDGVTGEMR